MLPLAGLVLCASMAAPPKKALKTASTSSAEAGFSRDVLPLVAKYCLPCHTGPSSSAGVVLSNDKTFAAMLKNRKVWERAADNVASKSMPPAGVPMPTDAERERIVQFLQSAISKADCALQDPGRVTMRRLNRAEYNNTIRDLTGLDLRLADGFPSDDVGYGFDNIGDVLTMSPLHLEKYMSAAGKVARTAIVTPEERAERSRSKRFTGDQIKGDGSEFPDTGGHGLFKNGESGVEVDFPAPGRYTFRVTAWEQHAGHDYSQMALRFDYRTLKVEKVMARQDKPAVFEAPLNISRAGKHRLSVAYLNNYRDDSSADLSLRGDRNLIIQSFDVVRAPGQPAYEEPLPASHKRIVQVYPTGNTEAAKDAATRRNIAEFARRAYRRPATPEELARLVNVARRGRGPNGSFERGMQVAVQAALVSPNFLFRVEKDPDPNNPRAKHAVSDYELASRLSYFLWSSMPDDRLLTLAGQNALRKPATLEAETRRMLKDPRAKALCDNFASQWLTLRKLGTVTPDPATFPNFNEELRLAMRAETEKFFQYVVAQDRPVTDFLDSDYTFLNESLAKLYGNTQVKGNEFRLVKLQGRNRGGVLTQASVLTVTSNPTRTSPVKRGKWVMENLLGAPIPPAPPNVPQLADDKKEPLTGTLRQRLEQHRKNPACASCHQRMDPIGFGLENFDAIGQWRTADGGSPVDSSGALPGGGKKFKGPAELKAAIKSRTPQFTRNLTEKLLTYALGRGVESYDRCNIDAMAQNVAQKNHRFSAIVMEIVKSEPFRYRRGDSGAGKVASAK
jgi:hypothetical protein